MEIEESSLVVPSEETPKETIWLSNLDLARLGPCYTSNVTLYRYNGDLNFFSIQTLKDALARALVIFYPFAGRIVFDENGRPELKCTGEGARFIVARSEYTIDEFEPLSEMSRKWVPQVESNEAPFILLMLQITYLKCGGVCLGVTMHHVAADGHTALHFINTWSQIAKGTEVPKSLAPSLDRTMLRARSPPMILYDHTNEYKIKYKTPNSSIATTTPIVTEIINISKEQIRSLKMQLQSPTTFRAVLAHIWRCTCKARGLDGEEDTRVFMHVNVRSRMNPMLPQSYFGNAIAQTTAKANVGEILSHPLGFAADKISEAITRVNDDYVRSIIDFIEVLDAHKYHDKNVDHDRRGTKTDLFVVSWLQLPLHETDFGWGKPIFMAKSRLETDEVVYLLNSPKGDGDNDGIF